MFTLDAEPAIAEELVLHHLQLAAALFELTSDDNSASLLSKLAALDLPNEIHAVLHAFITSMDTALSSTIPTEIPRTVLDAASRGSQHE